ncbi:MAG TPA: NepR family anti-sigma factor [Microvirga sp.]|jgi:hypothetical protein|nr:NepR family anti-sigma factor [Microvirga sp.]
MKQQVLNDWPVGQIVVVPHAWRGDGLLADIQAKTQCRIKAGLRAMYADLIEQPLPDHLERLIAQLDERMRGADER